MSQSLSLEQILDIVQGSISSHDMIEGVHLSGVNTLKDAGSDEISFLANVKYKDEINHSAAGWVLVAKELINQTDNVPENWIAVADPYLAFAQVQRAFHPAPKASGLRHPSAVIDPSAIIASDVNIGAGAIICENSEIADGTIVREGVVIGPHAKIGQRCLIHANVTIADHCVLGDRVILQSGCVIGSDGFGYAWTGSEHLKIPQTGRVVLENDVELGANTCIDRGALGDTLIRHGVKLDNLIQIGHNADIGALSIMASQVGISGSTKLGMGCQVGGQAGVAGHVNIGDGVKLAAKTGVMSDLDAGGTYGGMPAVPHRTWLKVSAMMIKLPEVWNKIRKLVN